MPSLPAFGRFLPDGPPRTRSSANYWQIRRFRARRGTGRGPHVDPAVGEAATRALAACEASAAFGPLCWLGPRTHEAIRHLDRWFLVAIKGFVFDLDQDLVPKLECSLPGIAGKGDHYTIPLCPGTHPG